MPAHRFDEVGIPLGGPDRGHVADQPEHDPGDPQSQSETESGRYGAVDDRDGAPIAVWSMSIANWAALDLKGRETVPTIAPGTCDRLVQSDFGDN
jgi:hypothetical protein